MLRRIAVGLVCIVLAGCSGGAGLNSSPGQAAPGAEAFREAQLRELTHLPLPTGVAPELWQRLKTALAGMIASPGKATRSAPATSASQARLAFNAGTGVLSWGYACQGDYNQNGEVGVSDLTPLGIHFGAVSGGGPFTPDSIEAVIDGSGDGAVGIADVTPIGLNFGNRALSYNIYQSTDPADLPASNTAPNGPGAVLLGHVALASATGTPATGRLQFSFTVTAPDPAALYWVRPNDAADGSGANGTPSNPAGPGAPVQSSIALFQISFVDASGSVVLANSTWGDVEVTFTGAATTLYFTLDYNGGRVLTNIPLVSDAGVGTEITIDLPFALGNVEGTAVTSATVAYTLSPTKSASALRAAGGKSAAANFVKPVILKTDYWNSDPYGYPSQSTAGKNELGRDPANDGVVIDGAAHDIPFPNQECPSGSNGTAAAVSNSLLYLKTKFSLAIGDAGTPIDVAAMTAGWAHSPLDASWTGLKDAYMKDHGYGISTTETYDIYDVIAALKQGWDVEVFHEDSGYPDFAHALTSVAIDTQNNVVTQEVWDSLPGQPGGQYRTQVWYKFDPSALSPHGSVLQSGNRSAFVIERPVEAPQWREKAIYENNYAGSYPSVAVAPSGQIYVSYYQSFTDRQIFIGQLSPKFLLAGTAVNINVDPTRTHGPHSKLIELPDLSLSCIYEDSVPFDNKLFCVRSTDGGATWGAPVLIQAQGSGEAGSDIDALIDQNGKLDVCYINGGDPYVVQAVDSVCSAFTAQSLLTGFPYGLHNACATDGAGNNVLCCEGSGVIKVFTGVDFSTGAATGPVTLSVSPSDSCPLGLVYNPDANQFQAAYCSSLGGVYFTTSTDGTSWTAPYNVYASPVVESGMKLALAKVGGVRIPAICEFESLTIALDQATNATGTTWSPRVIVSAMDVDPGPSLLDMCANPLDGSPVIIGPDPSRINLSVYSYGP